MSEPIKLPLVKANCGCCALDREGYLIFQSKTHHLDQLIKSANAYERLVKIAKDVSSNTIGRYEIEQEAEPLLRELGEIQHGQEAP